MGHDQALGLLLEQAAGPDPGDGDVGDVRRRRQRHRRHRVGAMAGGVVVAVLAVGLLAVDRPGPDGSGGVVAAGQLDPSSAAPGTLLFERELRDGSMLQVRAGDEPDVVMVEIQGAGEPVPHPVRAGVITVSTGTTAMPWGLAASMPCTGDKDEWLRLQTEDGGHDRMAMADGLAVVAVPRTPVDEGAPPSVHLDVGDVDDGVIVAPEGDNTGLPDGADVELEQDERHETLQGDIVDQEGNVVQSGVTFTLSGLGPEAIVHEVVPGTAGRDPGPDDPANPCG